VRHVCACAGVFDETDNSTICLGNIEDLNFSVYSPVFIIVTLSLKSILRDTIATVAIGEGPGMHIIENDEIWLTKLCFC